MTNKFSPLFQPFTLNNGVEIKNRLVVAPMTHLASNPDGTLGEQEARFIANRANDMGMFITAATLVADGGKAFYGQPEAIRAEQLPSLKKTADLIKAQGAKAILQIHHGGRLAIDELLNGKDKISASGDEAMGLVAREKTDAEAASLMDTSQPNGTRDATDAEVRELVAAFGNAADLAIQAGFDGVEIHGANAYLIQQFYSGHFNRRTDEWGGSREKRMRFPLAVIEAVLAAKAKHNAKDFIVGYRFSPEEPEELGITMEDTLALIDVLKEQPLQYLHISLWDFYKKARRGADTNAYRIQLIHQRIGGKLPLIGVGNLYEPNEILAAFQTGWAEFIALGKTVMVNPDIATTMKNGNRQAERELDPNRKADYAIPDKLWEMSGSGTQGWLPPFKGNKALMLDI